MEKTKSSLRAHLWKSHKVVERSQITSLLSQGLQNLSVNSASDQGIRFCLTLSCMQQKALFRQKADIEETVRKLSTFEFGSNVERPGVRNTFPREQASTSYHT